MFQIFVDYYKLYPSLEVFLEHKLTHWFVGMGVSLFLSLLQLPIVGLVIVFICAVIKEIVDHYESYDSMTKSYQYDAPLYAHVFDVLITFMGGLVGAGVVLSSTYL